MWEDCSECVDNAELVDGTCRCSEGFFFNDLTQTCDPCSLGCLMCKDDTIYSCTECTDGWYLYRDSEIC
jgi:hypothetical protein